MNSALMPWYRGLLAGGTAAVVVTGAAQTQDRPLIGETRTNLAPAFVSWRFAEPLIQDSLSVRRITQLVLPVSFAMSIGRWTIDVGGAVARGRVGLADGRNLDLNGVTDVRARAVGRIIGDHLLLTLGAAAPTGTTRLAGRQIDALRILGSPALGLPTPTLGAGSSVTAGLVYARRVGAWAVAAGGSFETRGSYSPIEAQIAGVARPTDLDPGSTTRFSLGADRVVGSGRVAVLVATDRFGEDDIRVTTAAGPVEARYRLGPQYSIGAIIDLGVAGLRSARITVMDRYRARHTGVDGMSAAGSNGNRFETSLEVTTGAPGRTGLLARLDGRLDSGLTIDNTITTAAMTGGGLTLGAIVPVGRATLQPYLRAQLGRVDTGPTVTTATGFGAGLTFTVTR